MYTTPQKLSQVDALSNSVHHAIAWLWALVPTALSAPGLGSVCMHVHMCVAATSWHGMSYLVTLYLV